MIAKLLLEVCVASAEDAIAAQIGGADRLELNTAIELGGLTPTLGLLDEVKQSVDLPVIAMVRPRAAGFRYSLRERRLMLRDAESLLERGADGVAVGALLHDGTIDCDFLAEIREWSSDRDIVFHRAFDLIDDPDVAIQQLIDCGIIRVLTAGGSATAAEGQSQIARLLQLAANRIEILPAGRISPDNVGDLIRATGCNQVHGSFGTLRQDPAGCISDSSYPSTCQLSVARTRAALDLIT